MKLLVLKIFLFATIILTAQNSSHNHQNYIEVSGTTQYDITVKYYEASVVLSQDLVYSGPSMDLETIKKTYYDNLSKVDVDINSITENTLGYLVLGYQKDGTLLNYRTASREEYIKFLSVKSLGIQVSQRNIKLVLTDAEMANLSKKAIDDARVKAKGIAKNLGKSVGEVISISDYNTDENLQSLYSDLQTKATYTCVVRFAFK